MRIEIYKKGRAVKQNYDWKEELRSRISSADELLEFMPDLPESPLFRRLYASVEDFRKVAEAMAGEFRFSVTPYYLSLANLENARCPILLQILPRREELEDQVFQFPDPLAEDSHHPVDGLTHRYPDRVLWYLSHNCAVYCRFCMRKRKVSRSNSAPDRSSYSAALDYIRNHKEIKEVILSGGDPLSHSDQTIQFLLTELRTISHLSSLRIHSRMPVTLPSRITDQLTDVMRQAFPVTLVTHFNHPVEITEEATSAVRRLRMNGVTVLNQTVLMRDINDSTQTIEALMLGLLRIGIKPYYLHQCDEVHGVSHFRANIETGLQILRDLQGRNPGIAIPRYVIDLPGGGGKVPLENQYLRRRTDDGLEFENWSGLKFTTVQDREDK